MLPWFQNIYQRSAARRMFARWSPIYEREVSENAYSAADRVATAACRILTQSGAKKPLVADIGIGTGLLSHNIQKVIPCLIAGLDFSEDMMSICAARNITELLMKCDVGKDHWPLESGSFSMVVSAGLLEYLTKPMLQHFCKEAARIVQQKGHLVFTYLPSDEDDYKASIWHGHSGTYLTCAYAPDYMESVLKKNGFEILGHSTRFKGCVFGDGSSYDYRLITAQKS